MDRRMRPCIRAALLAAIALATLLLGTCSETNIVALLTNEVKRANNKFLVVKSVEPANSATNVDPGAPIRIVFDRAVDIATLTEANITLTPNAGIAIDFQFNDLTSTLSVFVDPFLDNSTDYTLTVTKGVLAADGSDLESPFAWSFRTGIFPAGNVSINANALYTSNTTVTLNLMANAVVWKYRAAKTEPELAAQSWVILDLSPSFVLDAGDGSKVVYVQFLDNSLNESTVRSDTIVLDTVKPTITVNSTPIYQNLTTAAIPSISASDDRSGVNTTTFTWAGGVSFSPSSTVQTPSISTTGLEGTYLLTVTVNDLAGNTSLAANVSMIKDITPPSAAPLVTPTPASPAFTPAPRWDWIHDTTEPTQIFMFELRNSAGTLFYGRSSTTGKYYYPKLEWPDYTRGTPPDTYTMKVWERDLAGNTSTSAGTSVVAVTSVLPVDRAKGVLPETTFQWWTMTNPKAPLKPPESYEIYLEYWNGKVFALDQRERIAQQKGTDPSVPLKLRAATEYRWYILAPEIDMRSPLDEKSYWSFITR